MTPLDTSSDYSWKTVLPNVFGWKSPLRLQISPFLIPTGIFQKSPHFFKKIPIYMAHNFEKWPLNFFIAFLCNNFLRKIWQFGKKFLKWIFFSNFFSNYWKPLESKLAWIRKWLTRHIYCIFMYQISTNSWIFLLYCQIPT